MYRYNNEAYFKLTPILYDNNNMSDDDKISLIKEMYLEDRIDIGEYELCLDEIINQDPNRIWKIFNGV